MSITTLLLLAFLALGVGTLLWAIHEFRMDSRNEAEEDSRKPSGDA